MQDTLQKINRRVKCKTIYTKVKVYVEVNELKPDRVVQTSITFLPCLILKADGISSANNHVWLSWVLSYPGKSNNKWCTSQLFIFIPCRIAIYFHCGLPRVYKNSNTGASTILAYREKSKNHVGFFCCRFFVCLFL